MTEENVRSLSSGLNEPQWLADRRLEALRLYESTPMPDPREEQWRRTDISRLDIDAALDAKGPASISWKAGDVSPEDFARANHMSEKFYFGQLGPGIAGHEEAVKQHLHSLAPAAEWRLAALEAALWQGTLVYVPRGVEVTVPLVVTVEGNGAPAFPHLLIIAEENSSVTVIQDQSSQDGAGQALVSGAIEIIAKADARVRYIERQRWGNNTYSFSTIRAQVERGADVFGGLIGLGGKLVRTRFEAKLVGEGGHAGMIGLSHGNSKQHFDYITLQDHYAPHTSSDLLFKAALDDEASTVWNGTVRIHKGASQAEASQTSRNLLLSDHASASPIPVLEIEAFDVQRCSHGATAGPVDREQLFYLESRGIPPEDAESLLIEAFFHEAIDRIPDETFREQLKQDISAKIGAVS